MKDLGVGGERGGVGGGWLLGCAIEVDPSQKLGGIPTVCKMLPADIRQKEVWDHYKQTNFISRSSETVPSVVRASAHAR